ncbi:MAG: DUF123 domain-containing protein [Chlorobium sp.]
MAGSQFTLFGKNHRIGSYILIINLAAPSRIAFGKFQQGALFTIPAGDYLYIGSALGNGVSGSPLARRVLRHTTRAHSQPNHKIREPLCTHLIDNKITEKSESPRSRKKLRWHIDYLLDLPEAEITHIVLIRSPLSIEQKLAELVEQLDETSLIAPRLGAQDSKKSTHILKTTNVKQLLDTLDIAIPDMIKS